MANVPPPSPSQGSDTNDEANFQVPGPPPSSKLCNHRAWAISWEQQPQRARMCGFGDKDRRPISPPPCVRLVIMDPLTNEEIDYAKDCPELSTLILQVDLYSLDGMEERNLVRHTSSSPSISTCAILGYPQTYDAHAIYPPNQIPVNVAVSNTPSSTATYSPMPMTPGYGHGNGYTNGYTNGHTVGYTNGHSQNGHPPNGRPALSYHDTSQASGMYTRNLIGNLCSSAFKLKDPSGKLGIWFILQDLSVRTEGWFRLRATFVNIGGALESPNPSINGGANGSTTEPGRSWAPVLATAFSTPFKVFSAKKFPGVVESTELSRTFAAQGIKIPIRKEGATGSKRRGDASDDEGQEFEY